MSETCQKLAFTHLIVVLKGGLKNNWMKKLDRLNRPLDNSIFLAICLATLEIEIHCKLQERVTRCNVGLQLTVVTKKHDTIWGSRARCK